MKKFWLQSIYLSLLVAIPVSSLADIHKPEMAVTKKGMIVTCQPLAAQAGLEILRKGGNAADAFITTTLAEYVTAFGYTTKIHSAGGVKENGSSRLMVSRI